MKAIDILFKKLDELNSKIKNETETPNKLILLFQIEKTIDIIKNIEELRIKCGDEKCI